ncbi:MAG TPA: Uma2 family endonuclease [Tepidisphaeraceae bacterium]|jgi:Uma2 family endonuclease|nr:Uma2 family endonuclease [Tepidisphaeraceae bacterium]
MTLKAIIPTIMTADEFASLGDIGRAELVRGRLIHLTKPKPKHGRIAMRIGTAFSNFAQKHNLGEVYAAGTGFLAERNPDSVRAPDAAFVRADVVAAHDDEDWFPRSPDLAVEVLSPTERAEQVAEKVQMWLDGGARSVWVFDPKSRSATIHAARGTIQVFREGDDLRDDAVHPGFALRVKECFV